MSETEPKPAAGQTLAGRIGKYDILRPLGKGAMGMVYLAHDTVLERDVALKVMGVHIADDADLKQRFMREAKAVAKMTHPNVVNVFDLGSHLDGSPYIAMELLKGGDLLKSMRTAPGLSLERKVAVIVQVLAGLAHAHKAGIVHRDIKPANVFICEDGTVKIMDFGVARLTTASMTGTGHIVGTADYMSPEQVKGAKVDGRSDLFSVGAVLYELLTGRRPFHADNLMAIFYRITHEEPDLDLVPAGPEYDALLPILRRSLAKNLEERYHTAYDFAMDLREWMKVYGTTESEPLPSGLNEPQGPTLPDRTLGASGAPTAPRAATGGAGPASAATARAAKARAPAAAVAKAPTLASAVKRLSAPAATVQAAATVRAPQAPVAATPAPAPTARGAMFGGIALAVIAVAIGSYLLLQRRGPAPIPVRETRPAAPPSTLAAAPSTLAAPPSTVPAAPPPSAAPPPTFAVAEGKAAAPLRAAQVAFKTGQYDKALAQAQSALAEDPQNASARKLVDNAMKGQQASARVAQAEAALRQGDFTRARAEANAGREQAPWDTRVPDLLGRIQRAEQQAAQAAAQQAQAQQQAQQASQVAALLGQGEAALAAQKYDDALRAYDEVLKIEPQNQRASLGRASALGARAVAQAAASSPGRPPAGKAFVSGKTAATGAESSSGSVPPGFEAIPGVEVKRGTQGAELPGKIQFAVEPETMKPGERYTVRIYFSNEGSAPIDIRDMTVATRVNGRGASGPVSPLTKAVAPQQRGLLREVPDFWKEDTSSWSMEVTVRTARGEKYSNQLTWKQP